MPTAPRAAGSSAAWSALYALAHREVVRFVRQRNRVVGALGQPLLFWLLFGAGLDQAFRYAPADGGSPQSFQTYYFPGTLVLILLFTAIFATISIIEDRREGFLQAVLVAPVPRWAMVAGKIVGGSTIAVGQALLFLLLALWLPVELRWWGLLGVVLLLIVAALALTALGFVIAWRMESTQGFHAIMNLLLMPLWLLSGAFFPVPVLAADAAWGQWIIGAAMRVNPLTYTVAAVRQMLFPASQAGAEIAPLGVCWLVTVVFCGGMLVWAWRSARHRITGDLL